MTVLQLAFLVDEPVRLPPYPGATLRGVFGRALRSVSCTTGADTCDACLRRACCPYGALWEGGALVGEHPLRFADPPAPYLLEPPFAGETLRLGAGERFGLRLGLFGPGRAFVPHVVAAAARMAGLGPRGGRARLEAVDRLAGDGSLERLLEDGSWLGSPDARASGWVGLYGDGGGDRMDVRVIFETPVALKHRGRVAQAVDPELLTASAWRRLFALSALLEHRISDDRHDYFAGLARRVEVDHADLRGVSFERVSFRPGAGRRRATAIPVDGLLGSLVARDVPADLVELWQCASVLHVGRGAPMGLGAIAVAPA